MITLPKTIFDSAGKVNFLFDKITDVTILDVGKVLDGGKDPGIKVGDTVYLTVQFSGANIVDEAAKTVDPKTMDIEDFFRFYTDGDEQELTVRMIEPLVTTPGAKFNLLYLIDLGDLSSG